MRRDAFLDSHGERELLRLRLGLDRRPSRLPRGAGELPDGPPDAHGLTPRQQRVLTVIHDSIERRGYPPSMREIGERVGLTSSSSVAHQLRVLEEKGFLTHEVEQRTYVYRPTVAPQSAAVRAVRQIIDRFCGGSVEKLLVGMVADKMLDDRQLKELADRIAAEQESGGNDDGSSNR